MFYKEGPTATEAFFFFLSLSLSEWDKSNDVWIKLLKLRKRSGASLSSTVVKQCKSLLHSAKTETTHVCYHSRAFESNKWSVTGLEDSCTVAFSSFRFNYTIMLKFQLRCLIFFSLILVFTLSVDLPAFFSSYCISAQDCKTKNKSNIVVQAQTSLHRASSLKTKFTEP